MKYGFPIVVTRALENQDELAAIIFSIAADATPGTRFVDQVICTLKVSHPNLVLTETAVDKTLKQRLYLFAALLHYPVASNDLRIVGIHCGDFGGIAAVHPDAAILDVVARLESEDSGALVVSSNGILIEGIISERDVVRGLRHFGADVLQKKVTELMTHNVSTCTAKDRIAGIMALMDDQRIRHVPVAHDGKLSGLISMRDIIKLRLDEVQSEADAMRTYIGRG